MHIASRGKGLYKTAQKLFWDRFLSVMAITILDQYMYLDDQIDEESVCSKNGYFFNLNYKEKGYPRSLRVVSSNEFVMEYVRLCHKEKNGNNHYDGRVGDTYFSYNK